MSPAATNASASEQIAMTTARPASARTAEQARCRRLRRRRVRGTTVCRVAAVAAPTIRKPPAWRRSCWAVPGAPQRGPVVLVPLGGPDQQVVAAGSRPHQTDDDRREEAGQQPGEHHLGLAGEGHRGRDQHDRVDRGCGQQEGQRRGRRTPRATSRPAMGTEPHSQPGRATPAAAATGTANTGGRAEPREQARRDEGGDGRADGTPSTRNGIAWTAIATNSGPVGHRRPVEQVLEQGPEQRRRRPRRARATPSAGRRVADSSCPRHAGDGPAGRSTASAAQRRRHSHDARPAPVTDSSAGRPASRYACHLVTRSCAHAATAWRATGGRYDAG